MNAVMIPHTVPNSPMNGVMLAVVARNVTRFSSLFTSMDEARSSARSTAVRLLRVGRGGGRSGTGRPALGQPQLGGSARHSRPGTSRRAGSRPATGRPPALPRTSRSCGTRRGTSTSLLLDPAERPRLVEDDPPRHRPRTAAAAAMHDLRRWDWRRRISCAKSPAAPRAGAHPALELQCQDKQSRRRQQSLRSVPWGCAAGRARVRATVARHGKFCQTHDTMAVPLVRRHSPAIPDDPVPGHPQPRGDRVGGRRL